MAEALFERHPLPWGFGQSLPNQWCIFDAHMGLVMALQDPHPQLPEAIVRMSEMARELLVAAKTIDRQEADVESSRADSVRWQDECINRVERINRLTFESEARRKEAAQWEAKAVERAAEMQRLQDALDAANRRLMETSMAFVRLQVEHSTAGMSERDRLISAIRSVAEDFSIRQPPWTYSFIVEVDNDKVAAVQEAVDKARSVGVSVEVLAWRWERMSALKAQAAATGREWGGV